MRLVPQKDVEIRRVSGLPHSCCSTSSRLAYQEAKISPEPGDEFRCRFCGSMIRIAEVAPVTTKEAS